MFFLNLAWLPRNLMYIDFFLPKHTFGVGFLLRQHHVRALIRSIVFSISCFAFLLRIGTFFFEVCAKLVGKLLLSSDLEPDQICFSQRPNCNQDTLGAELAGDLSLQQVFILFVAFSIY